jgi:hypothetical protein
MPRHKSAPTRRCVHQFHEASTEPKITESCDTEQVNGSDDEDSSDEGSFDEGFYASHPGNSWLGSETLTLGSMVITKDRSICVALMSYVALIRISTTCYL